MKRIISFILALSICAGCLVGCGKKKTEDITESNSDDIMTEPVTEAVTESSTRQEIELQDIDPFESLTVEFEGTAPYATVLLNDNNKFMVGGSSVCEFKADKTENLKKGDIVTVTASCVREGVYNFTQTQKEYKVEGVAEYVSKLEDVPKDVMDKVKKQAEDMLTAEGATWEYGNKILEKKFIGNYFLMGKEGVDMGDSAINNLCLVYKVKTSMNGIANEKQEDERNYEEYYYAEFTIPNLVIMPDGNGSVKISELTMSENEAYSDYGVLNLYHRLIKHTYKGYRDLDSCFKDNISKHVDKYTYETNVDKKA